EFRLDRDRLVRKRDGKIVSIIADRNERGLKLVEVENLGRKFEYLGLLYILKTGKQIPENWIPTHINSNAEFKDDFYNLGFIISDTGKVGGKKNGI
nr:hypothetical protein [Nitrosopumilaceae archaeon]NIU86466.1 hypothetical protein [Nitrosopumilaceae archaeon]NIV65232.1 hypothetical protein [Nitrosopumilaceae archaeon]NIX60684.1 hypothetical protein [Nitrosopumilaceae archaeon]